ncbi:MAG TPA: cation diffusion facilitator family transporter, partial [Caulobacteraceae bacterium]|nr:cation diffusion facilitator family transporter [Caulobacteraceae bacterium]
LTAIKAAVWIASGSVSILASLADSGLDLIAALGTFLAVRYAAAPPDAEHRYGHGKAEAFASLVQAGLVFASAALVGQEAILRLLHPRPVVREDWALAVMGLSIALTGGLILAQTRLLRRKSSVAVSSDRTHYAADLASNIIALAGIGLAGLLGVSALDAVAALIVTAILLWGAVTVFREASNQLLDHELATSARARIVSRVLEDPAILDVHQVRTRASGPIMHVQMHADLDPDLSLESAHKIVVAAEKRILKDFPAADIIIHADPRGRAEPHGGAFAESYEG